VTLGFAILSIAAPYQTAVSIQNYVNSLLAIYTLIAGIRAWTQGHKPAKYFTIAWVVFMMGVISANMSTLGVIPGTPLTLYGYQMGSVFDVILISLAMGARINMLREAQQEDQRRLSDSQSQAIRYLKQYEDLYQNSISARFQLNSRGEITDCNPAFAAALGFLSVEEVVESKPHFDQFIASPHASIELWEALGSDTKVTGYELILMPRRGKAVNAILTMRQEASDQGYQWVGSFLDVTEKYDQEAALRKLEDNRNQSLQQLVMGVSHEMNTPLGNIRLATTHIKGRVENNEIPVDDELKIAIHQVTDNISRLAKLNQLIQSSMGASSSQYAESIYLRAWLGEWKQRTQHQHRHLSLEVISYPDTALWRGYTTLLEQVLNQLTENAVVHNAQKYEEGALYVRVATSVENGVLDIEFKDNGRGISAYDREKMFLPFFTTRRSEATKKGLGLYEVKNLVTNIMKGSIVSPDSSQGLTLNIRLPEAVKVKEDETDSDSMVSW
jgi:signal transduction histidine kinase